MPEAKVIPIQRASGQNLADRSDDELMALARDGSESAFDELVRRYQNRALHVVSRYLSQTSCASDIVQDAFVEVYRSLRTYRPMGRFPSFFYKILLNRCRQAGRRRSSVQRGLGALAALQRSRSSMHVESGADTRHLVRSGMTRLSHEHRSALALRYAAGLTQEEIAAYLDVPVGTVKSRISNGIRRLRHLLGDTR